MTLIADSGSSKIVWACISKEYENPLIYENTGNNPLYSSGDDVRKNLLMSLPEDFPTEKVTDIYFYGAGVLESKREGIRMILSSVFSKAENIFVSNDLLGAARALLGRSQGFAAILGTGMNSCLYDGEKISFRIPSLGFILGDEGSGSHIGRALLRDYLRGNMPERVKKEVKALAGMSDDEIISRIYSGPTPNRYCSGFCQYVTENKLNYGYCYSLISEAFSDFFENIVVRYPEYQRYKFNCVGSVAYSNKDILKDIASKHGMEIGNVLKTPIEELISFHSKQPVLDFMA